MSGINKSDKGRALTEMASSSLGNEDLLQPRGHSNSQKSFGNEIILPVKYSLCHGICGIYM